MLLGSQTGTAAPQRRASPGYAQVEIKGKLAVTGPIADDWKEAIRHSVFGVSVSVPGEAMLTFPGEDEMANPYRGVKVPPVEWRLFLGKNKKLRARVQSLKGKTVVVKGNMKYLDTPRNMASGIWRPQLVVDVASLEAAEDKKAPAKEVPQPGAATLKAGVPDVLTVQRAHSTAAEKGGEPGLETLRRALRKARNTDQAESAYKEFLDKVGPNGLEDLKCDADSSIALQAAWKELQNRMPEGVHKLRRTNVERFLGFLEGRIRCPLPSWWEKALTEATVHRRPDIIGYQPSGTFGYHWTGLRLRADAGVSVSARGGIVRIESRGKVLRLSGEDFTKARADGGDTVTVSIGEGRAYLALHDLGGFSYTLRCIDLKSRATRWTAEVWGSGRRLLGGLGDSEDSFVLRPGRVIVFGRESHGMYVEGFDADSGKNLFRFRTSLPWPGVQ